MENRKIRYLNARLLMRQECDGELIRFAERLDKSQPQTSAFAGENPTKGIGAKIARQIAEAFDKHIGWLDQPRYTEWRAAGLWQPDDRSVREPRLRYAPTLASNAHSVAIRHIPVISWAAAGELCEANDISHKAVQEWLFTAATKAGPHSYALRVIGDSMTNPYPAGPSYPHDTVIVVDAERRLEIGNRVIAKCPGEEATFKVYTEDSGRRLLKPLNPQYPIIEMTDDYHICGVVIGHWSDS